MNLPRYRGGTAPLVWTIPSCSGVSALAAALAAPPSSVVSPCARIRSPSLIGVAAHSAARGGGSGSVWGNPLAAAMKVAR
jgi:hypothetical protein